MKKIGSLDLGIAGTFVIKYDEKARNNPYCVYVEGYYKDDEHTYPTKHTKLLARYANLGSCTYVIHNYVSRHDEERR